MITIWLCTFIPQLINIHLIFLTFNPRTTTRDLPNCLQTVEHQSTERERVNLSKWTSLIFKILKYFKKDTLTTTKWSSFKETIKTPQI